MLDTIRLVAALLLAASPAPVQDSVAPVRWEHAELALQVEGGWRQWTTRDSTVAAGDQRRFARRIGAPELGEGSGADVRLLDHFGAYGWELVGCESREETVGLLAGKGLVRRCVFRRPRRA